MDYPITANATISSPAPATRKVPSWSNVKLDGTGTVFIDGTEIHGVRSYNISRSPHEPVTMTLELYVNLVP